MRGGERVVAKVCPVAFDLVVTTPGGRDADESFFLEDGFRF